MNEAKQIKEILIVAAEASSELYASRIIQECRDRGLKVHFFGIGSKSMEALGCEVVEYSEKMAVVGLWEVLAHWNVISKAFKTLVKKAEDKKPALALLLDYPDFNLRLAKQLSRLNVPVFYYISPQVWAWRSGRVDLIKKVIKKMLVVFPFEEGFYRQHGIDAHFVGHPLLDEVEKQKFSAEKRLLTREHLGIKKDDFLVGLLPGSRVSELKNNFESQLRAAELISKKHSHARFVILVAPSLEKEFVQKWIPADIELNYALVKADPLTIMQACDACIVASGTATLMTALAATPMVIMYKMRDLTAWLARRLVKGKFFGMPNLISEKAVVPELFQEQANPEKISEEISRFIVDENYYDKTKADLAQIKDKLGNRGANVRVTDEIQKAIGGTP